MRMRKFLAAALAAVMLIGMLPAATAAVTNPPANTEGGVTLGKQASELAGSDTTITLDVVANTNENPIAIQFVLDATQSFYSAQQNLSAARYNYIISRLSLLYTQGTLSVQDIEAVNRGLVK